MKNFLNWKTPIVFCVVYLLVVGLNAQTDAHYWTHQFGAKGLLLNGAVIASTEDETAVFYNPGAMNSEDDFNLSLSFLTPSYSIGNSLELWNSKFSFGLDYGVGRKKDDMQLVDFSNITADNLFEFTGDGRVISSFQSINFILAYDFSFMKKRK